MLPDRDLPALPALGLWVAAGAGALSLVAFRRPRQPWRQWSCPVPCAGDRLQRGFRVLGGNSTVFQRFPVRTAGRCRASRLRGPVRALVAAPGWRGGAPPLAVSPAHGGQEQPPGNTGNNSPQPPPQRKAPWKPRQTCWRRCPCCAGSRRWRSWRSLRGGGVCRNGRQRRPTSAAYPRVPTTRLQGETKHYGVREE